MLYRVTGVLGAIAVVAMLGAAQFASGHDLTIRVHSTGLPDETVNRAGKTDRGMVFSPAAAPARTISIHVDRVPGTSILVRMPRAQEAHTTPPSRPTFTRTEERKAVACEPVVSILTEIAKRLQPGRCIT